MIHRRILTFVACVTIKHIPAIIRDGSYNNAIQRTQYVEDIIIQPVYGIPTFLT